MRREQNPQEWEGLDLLFWSTVAAPNTALQIAQWAGTDLVPKANDRASIAEVKVVMSLDSYLVIDNNVVARVHWTSTGIWVNGAAQQPDAAVDSFDKNNSTLDSKLLDAQYDTLKNGSLYKGSMPSLKIAE